MKLENQVTSVLLSNKIHELGVTSPSMFYRDSTKSSESAIEIWDEKDGDYCPDNVNCYTVAELGEILLKAFNKLGRIEINDPRGRYGRLAKKMYNLEDEANARAKMLIYLLENNLITL